MVGCGVHFGSDAGKWARFVYRNLLGQLQDEADSWNVGLLDDMTFFQCGECKQKTSVVMTFSDSFGSSRRLDENKIWCVDCGENKGPVNATQCSEIGIHVESALRRKLAKEQGVGLMMVNMGRVRPLHGLLMLDPNSKEELAALGDSAEMWH